MLKASTQNNSVFSDVTALSANRDMFQVLVSREDACVKEMIEDLDPLVAAYA